MADEQLSPGWHLSNNGLQAIVVVCGMVVSVATLFWQSHNQHAERQAQQERHQVERIKQLQSIEDKLPRRVFLGNQ